MNSEALQPATREAPWPVALMSEKLRDWIDRLGTIWVEGELTQWQVRQGNVYGKLKDLRQDATVSINMWRNVSARLNEEFKQGDRVIVLVKANYWVKGGSLSMNVLDIKHVGLGDLLERLERLRAALKDEGLFDLGRKKPLPFLPQQIGLITGRDSDAEKDVLQNAALRWPGVKFKTIYTAVQGDRAAPEVHNALLELDEDPAVDVIIIARGGGDFQHLLPFSDETLVRAVAAAKTPVVSAIGHEADRPLLDEVADLRASTPTDAAKRVVPDVFEEREKVLTARQRIHSRVNHFLTTEIERIAAFRSRPSLAQPERMIDDRAEDILRWTARGAELSDRRILDSQKQVQELLSRLNALSPRATLERGYAIVQNADNAVVQDPQVLAADSILSITLAKGRLRAKTLD